jgi:hypothetical protein
MIYGYSWYLDCVSPGWNALIWNDYEAVFPLTGNKKWGMNYLHQPFFTQQLGLFFTQNIFEQKVYAFIQAIPIRYKFIDINLNSNNKIPGLKLLSKRKNHELDLGQSYHKLTKQYSTGCLRNVKKSKKNLLQIKPVTPDEVVAFFIRHKGGNIEVLKSKHYDVLKKLYAAALEKEQLLCYGAFDAKNELISCAAFFVTSSRIIFSLGTSSAEGRQLRGMHALMDYMIFQFAGHQMIFDFEGSEIAGIAEFYKGFGAEKSYYYRLKINRLPIPFRWFK